MRAKTVNEEKNMWNDMSKADLLKQKEKYKRALDAYKTKIRESGWWPLKEHPDWEEYQDMKNEYKQLLNALK